MLYGFDIGGTKIAFAVYDEALQCLFSEQVATPDNYVDFIAIISAKVGQADAQYHCRGSVGLGFPGAVDPTEHTVNCANVPAIKGRALRDDLMTALQRDVQLENDANCFLLSECLGGSAHGCATVLGVTLGTGVGGAIFANGGIISGKNSFAGEIGHFPLPATMLRKYPDLPDFSCGCGRQLCLETYVSGTGLTNLYRHYADDTLAAPAILAAYRAGDAIAHKVLDIYFDILAAGLGTVMLVIDADAIVMGGGLSRVDSLLNECRKRLPAHLLNGVSLPRISNAQFGAEGGVRGAALLNYQK